MYQISFYVPKDNADTVKSAMFDAGAGNINNYSNCAWQTEGMGQFMPTQNATPTIGEFNRLQILPEYKIEMVCKEACIDEVVKAMKSAHPYEEAAYSVIKLENK